THASTNAWTTGGVKETGLADLPATEARTQFHESPMKRAYLVFTCATASAVSGVSAQSVKVSPSTLVAVSSPDHAITEPHLAIDPVHTERLVAAVYQSSKPGL